MQPTSDGYRIFPRDQKSSCWKCCAARLCRLSPPPIPFLFVFSLSASFGTLRSFIPYFEHTLALLGKTVVMSAMRNLHNGKLCPRSETCSGCRPKCGIYLAHVWPLFGQRNASTKTPSETAELGGASGSERFDGSFHEAAEITSVSN
jgi:hypothetical protein